MKITKNFLLLICTVPLLLTAMEESTLLERKKSLEALSLEFPKYRIKYTTDEARQKFNELMSVFCPTKGGQSYDFLEKLRQKQDYLEEEAKNLRTGWDLFYLNQDAKNLSLQAREEDLQTREKKLNQAIAQAKNQAKEETKELMQKRMDQLAQTYESSLQSIKDASDSQYKRDYQDIEFIIESKYKTNLSQQQNLLNKYAEEIKKLQEEKETAYQDFEQKGRESFDRSYEAIKKQLEDDLETEKNKYAALSSEQNTTSKNPSKQLSFMQRYIFVPFGLGLFLGGLAMLHKGNITKLFTRDS